MHQVKFRQIHQDVYNDSIYFLKDKLKKFSCRHIPVSQIGSNEERHFQISDSFYN
jgi:hypothetical protein